MNSTPLAVAIQSLTQPVHSWVVIPVWVATSISMAPFSCRLCAWRVTTCRGPSLRPKPNRLTQLRVHQTFRAQDDLNS